MPTLFRQDAFTLRALVSALEDYRDEPGMVSDGGKAWTLPGVMRQVSEWSGRTYKRGDLAAALADATDLLRQAEAAPDGTAGDILGRMWGP